MIERVPTFELAEASPGSEGERRQWALSGVLDLGQCDELAQALSRRLAGAGRSTAGSGDGEDGFPDEGEDGPRIDLSGVERLDGAAAAVLLAETRGAELVGARPQVQRMLDLYGRIQDGVEGAAGTRAHGFFDLLGRGVVAFFVRVRDVFAFAGHISLSAVGTVRDPRSVHWRDLGGLMERAGADSIPIIVLINFLLGLIMGYQSALQLQRFGANIFLADLVGLSVTRELGPLMTAIIVAGRSGAAYAAELGTMQVRQEVDALATLALDPNRFLVFPRILALVLMVPLLTLVADTVAILGGLVIAVTQLDLTPRAYFGEMQLHMGAWDVFGGVLKSAAFAFAIGLIACQQGLSTRGGADAVGRATTAAVVVILFALVVIDAVFAVVYNFFEI